MIFWVFQISARFRHGLGGTRRRIENSGLFGTLRRGYTEGIQSLPYFSRAFFLKWRSRGYPRQLKAESRVILREKAGLAGAQQVEEVVRRSQPF